MKNKGIRGALCKLGALNAAGLYEKVGYPRKGNSMYLYPCKDGMSLPVIPFEKVLSG